MHDFTRGDGFIDRVLVLQTVEDWENLKRLLATEGLVEIMRVFADSVLPEDRANWLITTKPESFTASVTEETDERTQAPVLRVSYKGMSYKIRWSNTVRKCLISLPGVSMARFQNIHLYAVCLTLMPGKDW